MKVILQTDVKGQGKKGQLVDVSDGYARNYLLPRKLALEANAENINIMKTQEASKQHKVDVEKSHAEEAAAKLKSLVVRVPVKAGSAGRLFGSITTMEISEALKTHYGIDVPKNKLVMEDAIKTVGTYTVKAKLFHDVTAEFQIEVYAAEKN